MGVNMARIRVNPEELRTIARQWSSVLDELNSTHSSLLREWARLDAESFDVLNRARIESMFDDVLNQLLALYTKTEQLALDLERAAQEFENADQQGVASLNKNFSGTSLMTEASYLSYSAYSPNASYWGGDSPLTNVCWVGTPQIFGTKQATPEDVKEIGKHVEGGLGEILAELAHVAFMGLEMSAGHMPVLIFLDKDGNPLGIKQMNSLLGGNFMSQWMMMPGAGQTLSA